MIQGVIVRRNEKLVTLRGKWIKYLLVIVLSSKPTGHIACGYIVPARKKSVSLKLDRIASITELGFELDTSMSEN